jgi:perosamine synthetase
MDSKKNNNAMLIPLESNFNFYQKPLIPTSPVLSKHLFEDVESPKIPSVLDAGKSIYVTSGRVAIGLALLQMKIGVNDKVLLPSYHCSSMIEPIIVTGANPVFYKINSDTSVDFDDIEKKIDRLTKLLMVTNYFGFPQDLSRIRKFCDVHNIMLLEDCAHSFFGVFDGRPLGSFGNYAIASAMKFFPIYDGGCLISSIHNLNEVKLEKVGIGFEIKSAINAIEKCFEYDRLKYIKKLMFIPMEIKNIIWNEIKKNMPVEKISLGPGASDGGFQIENKWLKKRSTIFSKFIIKNASKSRIIANRRNNYIAIQSALEGSTTCHPLFPELPAGVVPYVFPLISNNPEKHFKLLKSAGIPVIRFGEFLWEDKGSEICKVSVNLSRRVMQLPCHQELSSSELEWMIIAIKKILLIEENELENL